MTAACVNLELWYTYSETQDYETIINKTYELAIQSIDEQLPCDSFIGLLLCEGFLYKNNEIFYNLLERVYDYAHSKGIKKFYIIAGIAEDYQQELDRRNLDYEIVFWDFSVNGMYQSYKDKLDSLPKWNFHSEKFLFLGGVPSRPNRIGLLSRMYDRGILNKAEWSFFKPNTKNDKEWCRRYLNQYTDQQYEDFLNYAERSVDDRYIRANQYSRLNGKEWVDTDVMQTEFLKDPNYMDPEIFSSTGMSIVSEGYSYPPITESRFLTEKTWRAIVHRHPFMLADSVERYEYLKSKGIRMFEKYLLHPDYVYNRDNKKFDKIIENITHFFENIKSNSQSIQEDLEHNYEIFLNIVRSNDNILNQLSINKEQKSTWFDQRSFLHLFRIPK